MYRISGKLVLPGEELCIVEEFIPGSGTYEYNGSIRASRMGIVLYDFESKIVTVRPVKRKYLVPKVNTIVYGKVYTVHQSEDLAFIRIYSIENEGNFPGFFTGILHVSQVSEEYCSNIEEACKPGDLIRAKVLNTSSPYQLTTKHPTLGVVLAYCSKCGEILVKRQNSNQLYCPSCKTLEKRKVSTKYFVVG